ncbi:uncharacterized protein DNG_01667 [Cephalotrichum gorgonifer]|uniref:Uncharacterized protein n=1 Tax=Cephalotrichum gorgonifer TaxID=2041049 RepID=A0AAE8MRC4_9PEZI|nr:uncharacterized protein DNG_01667 [Cephalotrichum gorgonifer]
MGLPLDGKSACSVDRSGGRPPLSFLATEYSGNSKIWELSNATRYGNIAVVKQLLEDGVDVNSRDSQGRTPLLRASRGGHPAVVHLLLEYGANTELKYNEYYNYTPLSRAAMEGHVEVVRILLQHGADTEPQDSPEIEAPRKGRRCIQSPLSWAAGGLSWGAQRQGRTDIELFWAARAESEDIVQRSEIIVRLLLEHGANTEPKNNITDDGDGLQMWSNITNIVGEPKRA